jgi:diadenosine tetraphosphate (Ap4A) HIT family hydrolase
VRAELANQNRWDQWAQGTNCPFDGSRAESNDHWDFVASLLVSSLYLQKNQTYHGHCILIWDTRHAVRIDQLSSGEWAAFCADLYVAERAIMQTLNPDHINLEILGNVVPHLHWQIVPRYRTDPRWEGPIWTTTVAEMPVTSLSVSSRTELIEKLRSALADANSN